MRPAALLKGRMTIQPLLASAEPGLSPLAAGAIACGIVGTGLVIAGALALLGLHPVRFAVRTTLGAIVLLLGAVAGIVVVGVQGYRGFSREDVAARILVRPTGPQHFTATVRLPDGHESTFAIAGDELSVEAHILKWKPLANRLGLHTAYELDRIAGRYRDVRQERAAARTVYPLGAGRTFDLFDLRQRYAWLGPFLDVEYGSGTFVSVTRPATLEVRVSTSGLLIREGSALPPAHPGGPR